MKILLTTLNSKYIHTALSLEYLYYYCREEFNDIRVEEYTINHDEDFILGEIYKGKYDVVCFSCYIWNITSTINIINNLKKVCPQQINILGGPEVSFDSKELMEKYSFVDYIVVGEGEITLRELLRGLVNDKADISKIPGIVHRFGGQVVKNQERELINQMNLIPTPYQGNLEKFNNKIIYYESSRGCPFNCTYCLSSTIKGVRYFSLDRVKIDIARFLHHGVSQVKFVDRTFNSKKDHSFEIMRYIKEKDNGTTNFHFEITVELLDDEIMNFLSGVREGLFQFEIGVQTTYEQTLKSIERPMNFNIIENVVKKISSLKNIHLHLDLIAGLPYETYDRFKTSFDDVYDLKPEKLQLGFLKLLKGSAIRREKDIHQYIFNEEAPYEVMQNKYIGYGQLLKLKMMAEMVEKLYNSKGFQYSTLYAIENYFKKPSEFYEALTDFWDRNEYQYASHGKNGLYKIILDFYGSFTGEDSDIFHDLLKLDYLAYGKGALPDFFKTFAIEDFKNRIHQFLKNDTMIDRYLPSFKDIPTKNIFKKVHFECFDFNVLEIMKNPRNSKLRKKENVILFDYNISKNAFYKSKYYSIQL